VKVTENSLARFFEVTLPHVNEREPGVVGGAAVEMLGRGATTAVAAASGMSRNTVIRAAAEVQAGIEPSVRLRAPGGGHNSLIDAQPGLLEALDKFANPEIRSDPTSTLRWTSRSSTKLADDLMLQGFMVISLSVLRLLHKPGYSWKANANAADGR
jgi:hypothetical protein